MFGQPRAITGLGGLRRENNVLLTNHLGQREVVQPMPRDLGREDLTNTSSFADLGLLPGRKLMEVLAQNEACTRMIWAGCAHLVS